MKYKLYAFDIKATELPESPEFRELLKDTVTFDGKKVTIKCSDIDCLINDKKYRKLTQFTRDQLESALRKPDDPIVDVPDDLLLSELPSRYDQSASELLDRIHYYQSEIDKGRKFFTTALDRLKSDYQQSLRDKFLKDHPEYAPKDPPKSE